MTDNTTSKAADSTGLGVDSQAGVQADTQNPLANHKPGISGSTIKIIAVISMLIDHTAAGILPQYITTQQGAVFNAYMIMRFIGRLGFPIFCFLLVEGFEHTRSVKKYAGRLLLFALISEVPFDLLFKGKILEFTYQNVYFTLFIGLVVMAACRFIENNEKIYVSLKSVLCIAVTIAGMVVAQLLKTDYAAVGVFCIMILYFTRLKKSTQIIAGCIAFAWELTAPLAFIPIGFYNHKRGLKMKYFFYAFYPAHLLILYLIRETLTMIQL